MDSVEHNDRNYTSGSVWGWVSERYIENQSKIRYYFKENNELYNKENVIQ